MSEINVLDSSAILAFLAKEPGAQIVDGAMKKDATSVSVVNMCEVLGKLLDNGLDQDSAREVIASLRLTLVTFDEEAALQTALLKTKTKSIGASLGDRACLALAAHRLNLGDKPTVLTTDRVWTKLQWPFKIQWIR